MKVKYLARRGNVYQFNRRVPDDVRPVVGNAHWRISLKTDSLTDAETACRKHTVETDEIIESVRSGTHRLHSKQQLEDFAMKWSLDFNDNNRRYIAQDMFPDIFAHETRIGDEAPSSILGSRQELEASVSAWLRRAEPTENFTRLDHETLIDCCLDEYLVGNPEISNQWKDVLADAGVEGAHRMPDYVPVIAREVRVPQRRRLSEMFKKYVAGSDIGESAEYDFGLGVRRFVQLHGDLEVAEVNRRHIEDFRDMLRQMPSRPPNDTRKLPMTEQVAWAEGLDIKRLGQAAINKNIGGVKLTLQYAFDQTSEIANRDWRNPCDGFTKKPKKSQNPVRGFTKDEISRVFSEDVHKTKNPEDFWIPVVLYFTGARLDEISQLHIGDVKVDPVPHFVCENMFDENMAVAKKVKSISANRTIPIHRQLIEIGFLSYVC